MFSWYKYLIVSLFFSHLDFWSGNLFLIAPFPDLCLLVPFHLIYYRTRAYKSHKLLVYSRIIDFNEVDIRIYLPGKNIFTEAVMFC